MTMLTRRSLVGHAAIGLATFGGMTSQASAQLVYSSKDWNIADFERLIKHSARVKQVFDEIQIGNGRFLNNIKNSLNGLHFGFNIPADQIKIISAMHGPANALNFDDYVWKTY